MQISLIQNSMLADPAVNVEKAIEKIRSARSNGAEVICLPELFSTPYFCQVEDTDYFDLAEPFPGPLLERLVTLAGELEVVLVVPFFEKRAPGVFHNSAAVIDADGSILGLYRKMHIPDDPGFYEKFYFAPGDLGFRVWETRYGKIGVCICWDQWFPEAARLTALKGAEVIFYPTAIGWIPEDRGTDSGADQLDAWLTVQRSHAISNGCYIAAANRTGLEKAPDGSGEVLFWGNSFVVDPTGKVISQAGETDEIVFAETSQAVLETQRVQWPFLRDRRIDSYEGLEKRYLDDDE